ncbi:hypothetical protein [Methylobacterium radiotolerans]|uniref:hypothetical protein n=1 Tax=Methylobacterium radiotolerans TaxID=31998 RepID=UPI0010576887|nr:MULTISPECIES: hypothetical protein [Methylobacterium]MDE3750033.1 hypothetical protein [Methylobacterium radiotolerans]
MFFSENRTLSFVDAQRLFFKMRLRIALSCRVLMIFKARWFSLDNQELPAKNHALPLNRDAQKWIFTVISDEATGWVLLQLPSTFPARQ